MGICACGAVAETISNNCAGNRHVFIVTKQGWNKLFTMLTRAMIQVVLFQIERFCRCSSNQFVLATCCQKEMNI